MSLLSAGSNLGGQFLKKEDYGVAPASTALPVSVQCKQWNPYCVQYLPRLSLSAMWFSLFPTHSFRPVQNTGETHSMVFPLI